jgi:hypothetical protein
VAGMGELTSVHLERIDEQGYTVVRNAFSAD